MACDTPNCYGPKINNPCPSYPDAKCVVYKGVNLSCIDVTTNDRLDAIIQKINDTICEIGVTYLEEGDNITITGVGTINDPYIISASGGALSDEKIKISGDDTTAGYLEDKLVQGQGVLLNVLNDGGDESLEVTLDLEATTLVSPVITVDWDVYQDDGTTPITTSTSANITVETGSKVSIDSTYLYPTPGVGEAAPTSVSGTWGATLIPPATPSAPFTNGGVQITTNQTYTQTLSKPKSGLIVVGDQVEFASGNDTTSASISVAFLYASYFGYSTNTSLTGPQIKALGNKTLQSSRTRTLTGVSAGVGEYTYYCYPASYGALTNVIQDNSLPVLGAFTRLSDVNITNDAGITVLMAVYKSNADNAFTNVELDFE